MTFWCTMCFPGDLGVNLLILPFISVARALFPSHASPPSFPATLGDPWPLNNQYNTRHATDSLVGSNYKFSDIVMICKYYGVESQDHHLIYLNHKGVKTVIIMSLTLEFPSRLDNKVNQRVFSSSAGRMYWWFQQSHVAASSFFHSPASSSPVLPADREASHPVYIDYLFRGLSLTVVVDHRCPTVVPDRPQQLLHSKQLKHHGPGRRFDLLPKPMQGQRTTTVTASLVYFFPLIYWGAKL